MKKKQLQIFIFLLFISFIGCIKDDDNNVQIPPDNIYYQELNDTLIGATKDTLTFFSLATRSIFEIYRLSKSIENTYGARISNKPTHIFCDCGNDFLCKNSKGYLSALNYNDFVTENGLWGSNDSTYRFTDFTGKGQRYLGFRQISFPTGESYYCNGWIRIYLSARNDTLIIYDYAVNRTQNKGIKAGQKNNFK
jgi:hypothetical protein